MNRPYKLRKRNRNNRLLFALLVPILLITLSSFGYAQWNDTLTVISYMQAGIESIRIGCEVTYYNGYGDYTLDITEDTLHFEDTNLFPGWELELLVEIHNDGTIPVYLSYEIFYSWDPIDPINWVQVADPEDPIELYDEFRIVYTDGFYNATTGEPWDPSQYLWPCKIVHKKEHLLFDAQDRPDLQGKTFTIKVEICGSCIS